MSDLGFFPTSYWLSEFQCFFPVGMKKRHFLQFPRFPPLSLLFLLFARPSVHIQSQPASQPANYYQLRLFFHLHFPHLSQSQFFFISPPSFSFLRVSVPNSPNLYSFSSPSPCQLEAISLSWCWPHLLPLPLPFPLLFFSVVLPQ